MEIKKDFLIPRELMTQQAEHVKVVCGLYRRALRWAFDWHFDLDKLQRTKAAIRIEFDRYKSLKDSKEIKLVMDACRYILWKRQHPQPYKCTCLIKVLILIR